MSKQTTTNSNGIGYRIRELRQKKRLSQRELAQVIGCAQTTIAGWEALPQRAPGKKFIGKVAKSLGVTVDYLLEEKEANSPQIPCYQEVSKDTFTWENTGKDTINVAKDEYKVGRFSLRFLNSYMEPFISKGDYCIFEKKWPEDRNIVVVRFPEKNNSACIRMWRQENKNVALVVTNPHDSRPILFYQIHKKEDDRFLINWKPKETMVVEGVLVGMKRIMEKI